MGPLNPLDASPSCHTTDFFFPPPLCQFLVVPTNCGSVWSGAMHIVAVAWPSKKPEPIKLGVLCLVMKDLDEGRKCCAALHKATLVNSPEVHCLTGALSLNQKEPVVSVIYRLFMRDHYLSNGQITLMANSGWIECSSTRTYCRYSRQFTSVTHFGSTKECCDDEWGGKKCQAEMKEGDFYPKFALWEKSWNAENKLLSTFQTISSSDCIHTMSCLDEPVKSHLATTTYKSVSFD